MLEKSLMSLVLAVSLVVSGYMIMRMPSQPLLGTNLVSSEFALNVDALSSPSRLAVNVVGPAARSSTGDLKSVSYDVSLERSATFEEVEFDVNALLALEGSDPSALDGAYVFIAPFRNQSPSGGAPSFGALLRLSQNLPVEFSGAGRIALSGSGNGGSQNGFRLFNDNADLLGEGFLDLSDNDDPSADEQDNTELIALVIGEEQLDELLQDNSACDEAIEFVIGCDALVTAALDDLLSCRATQDTDCESLLGDSQPTANDNANSVNANQTILSTTDIPEPSTVVLLTLPVVWIGLTRLNRYS